MDYMISDKNIVRRRGADSLDDVSCSFCVTSFLLKGLSAMPRLLDDFPSVRFSFYINHHNAPFEGASWEELGDA